MADSWRRRQARFQLAMAALSFGVAAALYVARYDLEKYFNLDPRFLLIFVAGLILQGLAFVLLLYLKGDILISFLDRFLATKSGNFEPEASVPREAASVRDVDSLKKEVASLHARIASLGTGASQAASVDYEKLLGSLRSHVTENLATELEERLGARVRQSTYVLEVRGAFEQTSARLRQEIASLTRRGNLNLVIGVLTTALAVGLLAYMVLGVTTAFDSWPGLLSYYVPRVSTAAFIEVFSFFFLRLYRSTLAEIKYYQNELTTLAAQHIAFEAAHAVDDQKAKVVVVERLARANRNQDLDESAKTAATTGELKEVADLLERVVKLVVSTAQRAKAE